MGTVPVSSPHDHDRLVAVYGTCPRCVSKGAREAAGRALPTADDEGHVRTTCAVCHQELELNEPRVHRLVSGWSTYRGAAGGTHTLRLRQEHHRYAHGECIDRVKAGHLNQPTLDLPDPGF